MNITQSILSVEQTSDSPSFQRKRESGHPSHRRFVAFLPRRSFTILGIGISFLAALAASGIAGAAASRNQSIVTIRPLRDDALMINPGKGWSEYGDPDPRYKDVVSIGYCHPAWCVVEPSEVINSIQAMVIDTLRNRTNRIYNFSPG